MLLLVTLAAAGCRSEGRSRAEEPQTLTVFAAASLADAFEEMVRAFEQVRPGVRVRLNVAGSQQLAQQLAFGAPAGVFAAADTAQMQVAVRSGRVAAGAPQVFTRNRLALVTPADNPAGVQELADLAAPGLRLVLPAEAVPAGRYARRLLHQAGAAPGAGADYARRVQANAVSFEQSVRAVLTKVALGEADAGLVYATDAAGARAEDLRRIPISDALNVTAAYPLAPVTDAAHPALAAAFTRFVLSERGQSILLSYGFLPVRDARAAA